MDSHGAQLRFTFDEASASVVSIDGTPVDRVSIDHAPVFVRHPRARRYVLRLLADGTPRVTIPRRGSRREAERFLEAQRDWVARQRASLVAKLAGGPPSTWREGHTLLLRGVSHALRRASDPSRGGVQPRRSGDPGRAAHGGATPTTCGLRSPPGSGSSRSWSCRNGSAPSRACIGSRCTASASAISAHAGARARRMDASRSTGDWCRRRPRCATTCCCTS